MPHVIVKLYPGRSEEQKKILANEIVKDVVAIAKCEKKSVSVAFEEIEKENWAKKFISQIFLMGKAAFTKNQDIIHLRKAGKSETNFLCMLADLGITMPLEQTA